MQNKGGLTILWDFDGTLFDTYPVYTKLFKQVLSDKDIPEKEIYRKLKLSFTHAKNYYNFSDKQLKEFFQLEEKLYPSDIKPFSGVKQILNNAENNVIMTHKPRKDVRNILKYYGWDIYFSEIVAGDDGFPRKPSKESYQYLHNKYGVDLVIGDRDIDILPAKELGIATCLFRNNDCLIADYYLDNYEDFWMKVEKPILQTK